MIQTIDSPAITEIERELDLVEERVVTGYTLADAIREGVRGTKQAMYSYISSDGTASCALGAAWLAAKAHGYISE